MKGRTMHMEQTCPQCKKVIMACSTHKATTDILAEHLIAQHGSRWERTVQVK